MVCCHLVDRRVVCPPKILNYAMWFPTEGEWIEETQALVHFLPLGNLT